MPRSFEPQRWSSSILSAALALLAAAGAVYFAVKLLVAVAPVLVVLAVIAAGVWIAVARHRQQSDDSQW